MTASRRTLLGGLALAAPLMSNAQHHHAATAPSRAGRNSFDRAMHAAMRAMAEAMDAAPMTANPDADFLAMMIPHHQGAVDMASLVLIHGRDPLTRQLAEAIIASQQAEIASMQARFRVLTNGGPPEDDQFPALSGTRGE
jgi:uncharacterized protein (DUF305 family)